MGGPSGRMCGWSSRESGKGVGRIERGADHVYPVAVRELSVGVASAALVGVVLHEGRRIVIVYMLENCSNYGSNWVKERGRGQEGTSLGGHSQSVRPRGGGGSGEAGSIRALGRKKKVQSGGGKDGAYREEVVGRLWGGRRVRCTGGESATGGHLTAGGGYVLWGEMGSHESRSDINRFHMKQQEGTKGKIIKKGGFADPNKGRRKQDRFTLLIKNPKEIFALEKGKFKAPPPMMTPIEKRNHTKFCEFHGEVGHKTDECKDEETEGPMIIEAEIEGHYIHRMYVDGDSASEILYDYCFSRLRQKIKNQLAPATTPLIGFSSEIIWPIGQIQLLVRIGDEEHSTSALMNFVVVKSPSPYNGIIGRPGVRKLQAVLLKAHGMLKIPVEGGVITLKSSRMVLLECAMVSGPEGNPLATKQAVEERVKVEINSEYPEQTVMIGSTLTEEGRNKLCGLLQHNLGIFTWKLADMIGVPRHIVEHRLNVRKGCSWLDKRKWDKQPIETRQYRKKLGNLWRHES
ncbi:hypothetical protein Tco_1191334 [Tanacetum coccineum]